MFVPVLCPDSLWLLFYNSKYQALAAAPKTRLSDWTGFTTTRSIKLWLLKLLPDLQWSHWLVLLYLLCSPAKLCPGLTLTILLFSSRLPFPTVWTLTSALLISVLSINVTPLIILHLGLSLVNWCDKTLTPSVFFLIPLLISPFSNQAVLRFLSEWCSSVQTPPTIDDWQGRLTLDPPWVSCELSVIVSPPVQGKTRISLIKRFRCFVVGCQFTFIYIALLTI